MKETVQSLQICSTFRAFAAVSPAFHHRFTPCFTFSQAILWNSPNTGPFFASMPLRPAELGQLSYSLAYRLTCLANRDFKRISAVFSTWNRNDIEIAELLPAESGFATVLLLLLSLLLVCFFYSIPRRADQRIEKKHPGILQWEPEKNHQILLKTTIKFIKNQWGTSAVSTVCFFDVPPRASLFTVVLGHKFQLGRLKGVNIHT